MHRGEALGSGLLHDSLEGTAGVLGGWRRKQPGDQLRRRFLELAGEIARGIPLDPPIGRIPGGPVESGQRERLGVDEQHVPVAFHDHHWPVGKGLIEKPAVRDPVREIIVGPTPSLDPPGGMGRGVGAEPLDDLGQAAAIGQIGLVGGVEVPVGVDESGHHQASAEVGHDGAGPLGPLEVGGGADRLDPITLDCHGFGEGVLGRAGPDPGVDEDPVGRPRGLGGEAGGQEGQGQAGEHERHLRRKRMEVC